MTCHSCGGPITVATESPVADTCADCLADCPCWVCRETRDDMGEDRAEQVAFEASREAS